MLRSALLTTFIFFVQLSYSQSPNEWLCQGPWLYVHTFTVESSAVIQSEEVAGSILAFHDYGVVEIDQNGQFTGGIWRLEGDQLMVRLGDKKQFTVKELQPGSLILEFSQTQPITGTFQYHFRPEQSNVVPSSKEMVKTSSSPPSSTSPPNSIQRLTRPAPGSMIQIELRGGGYQSKDNPVLKNELMIRSDGQIYFEYMKVQGERLFSKKIISESELEEVANFLFNQGFFELADHYTCQDAACSERLLEEPTPIPIQLAFQYGNYRKVVTLSIYSFEPGYRKVLNYPESIDRMIQAVRRIAE